MDRPVIHLVAGARPNFMKIAPIHHALRDAPWCRVAVVHTGQHYDVRSEEHTSELQSH